jgi:hypothetical protein
MALSKKREVEDLADALVRSADAIHERIINGIENNQVQPVQAYSLFQDETSLRVKANALYLEAVKLTVSDLEIAQANLIKVMDKATSRIKTIETIAGFVDLVADLLVLAAAAYAAKPGPIIAALDEVRRDVGELEIVRALRTSRTKRKRRKARGRSAGS